VGAEVEDQVVQLAGQGQRPEPIALRVQRGEVGRRLGGGSLHRDLDPVAGAVDPALDVRVADAVAVEWPLEGPQRGAAGGGGPGGSAPPAARFRTVSSSRERGTSSSTRPHSTARWPFTPSSVVQKKSARSRRIFRLSTSRVSPPVPGSTPRSGTSGSDTE